MTAKHAHCRCSLGWNGCCDCGERLVLDVGALVLAFLFTNPEAVGPYVTASLLADLEKIP